MGHVLTQKQGLGLYTPKDGAPGDLGLVTYRGIDYIAAKTNSEWKYAAIDKIFDGRDTDTVKNVKSYGAIGNGAADEAYAINRAIADLPNGGTVYFPHGVYKFDTKSINLIDNLTIAGAGIGATKIDFYKTSGASGTGIPAFKSVSKSLISFRDLEIDGNAVNNGTMGEFDMGIWFESTDKVIIKNCYIHDTSGDGIYIRDCDDVTIESCIISVPRLNATGPQVGRNGIAIVQSCTNIKMSNCFILGGYPAAIDIEPGAAGDVNGVTVVNCEINGLNGSNGYGRGISIGGNQYIQNIKVIGCTVYNCTLDGIRIQHGSTNYTKYIRIVDTVSRNNTLNGIEIAAATDVTIANCETYLNTLSGITIATNSKRVMIDGCKSHQNVLNGINSAGGSGNEVEHINIQNCQTYNNDTGATDTYHGLRLRYSDNAIVSNNNSYDDQGTAKQWHGLNFDFCDNIVIVGNMFDGNKSNEITDGGNNTYVQWGHNGQGGQSSVDVWHSSFRGPGDSLIHRIHDGAGTYHFIITTNGGVQLLKVTSDGVVSIGGTTNYTKIEADGTLEFNGNATVFDDIRTPLTAIRITGPGGTTPPDEVLYKGSVVLAFGGAGTDDEKAFFVVQIPHSYKQGSNIVPHIHWTPEDNGAGNVRWVLTYSWANIGSAFPVESTDTQVFACDTVTDKHQIDGFTAISGTGKTISSMLLCSIQREDSDASDTYDNKDAYLLEIDFHFEKDMVGSRLILTK